MAFTTFGTVFVDNVTPVPAAFLNKLRTEQADALDAIGGGTYVNLTPIIFDTGSAGWAFGAGVTVLSGGFLTVAGPLAVAGAATFTGAVSINSPGSLTLASSVNLVVGGNATVTGTLTGNGATSLTGNTSITGNVTQPLTITATQPSSSADPGANNRIHATNIPKAWAHVRVSSGGLSVIDGYNIQSVAVGTTTNECRVTFTRAMANASYVTLFSSRVKDFQATSAATETTTFVEFNVTRSSTAVDLDIASPVTDVDIVLAVFARQ